MQAGQIGSLLRFENTFASWNPAMKHKWMSDPAVSGGGSFIDTGCHSLDLFRFLVGDGSVVGAVFARPWDGRGESNATVMLRGHDSATSGQPVAGVIESGWLEPARFTLSLIGTGGMLAYDYDRPSELMYRPMGADAEVVAVGSHETRFERQLAAFVGFAAGGGAGNLASFADGLEVAQLVDQAQQASII
jgi:predicted dehydrogenase